MKHEHHSAVTAHQRPMPTESGGEIRAFAGWMGLILIAFGVSIAGYLLLRIGEVVIDPRGFETQVDRWEFVVRGRVSDALPDAYETPDRTIVAPSGEETAAETAGTTGSRAAESSADVEKMAEFVGRVASKSARPTALFLIVIVLTIIVRIIIAIINAGIRLVYVTAGDKEYMKRIIDELVEQRRQ